MNGDNVKGDQASSYSATGTPTLVNLALDLQILICTLLHPSDILALRETCKTLQLGTQQRAVWAAALHKICIDNSLFLLSFPILDMSDAELEHAAMAPRRWIELCATFEKQHLNDSGATLRPRRTRNIERPPAAYQGLFIVPGGRYMFNYSCEGIFIWDLGCAASTDCKLIASVGEGKICEFFDCDCMVQGLIILNLSRLYRQCSIYEIYPQSETPQLTGIAHLDTGPARFFWAYLLPGRVVWYDFHDRDRMVFFVWDYQSNHSISFSADADIKRFTYGLQVVTTNTAIIILYEKEILVWSMPPLLPQPPDFFDRNPIRIPPLFVIAFPDGIVRPSELIRWQTMSHWYFGSSQPLYFDILCSDSKLHKFKIIVKPDLFDTSLHFINTELVPHDFLENTFHTYGICENALVFCWSDRSLKIFGVYTGLTSSRHTTVTSRGGLAAKTLLPIIGHKYSLCPASGRYVYLDDDSSRIVVVDLF